MPPDTSNQSSDLLRWHWLILVLIGIAAHYSEGGYAWLNKSEVIV